MASNLAAVAQPISDGAAREAVRRNTAAKHNGNGRPAGLSPAGTAVAEPSVKQKGAVVTQTHRCRLYRLKEKFLAGKDLVTEFWDYKEAPRDPGDLPPGAKLLRAFTGTSAKQIRDQIADYRAKHGNFFLGDHGYRGSI